jgi:prepilin-type N-terminal cleavage/methylation domain-containing protein
MFRKIFEAEEGFTLVELLVTIAILAVLFGIVTLTLTGVGSGAENSVKVAECAVVQSAVDIYMANTNSATVPQRLVGDAAVIDTGDATWADLYLRDMPTSYTYWWTPSGNVTCVDAP